MAGPFISSMPSDRGQAEASSGSSATPGNQVLTASVPIRPLGPPSSVPSASQAAERSRSVRASQRSDRSRSYSHSEREQHDASPPTAVIIRNKIIGVPYLRATQVPAQTFLATTVSILLYLAVMVIIFSVDCPFDRDVAYFFAFILLAFSGSLLTMVVNLRAVRHHKHDCVGTSLSLLYSGSAALVLFGLLHTGIYGLCKPAGAQPGSVFISRVTSNYFIWVMSGLSVLQQLVAHYCYG